jgi:hypothetical protein
MAHEALDGRAMMETWMIMVRVSVDCLADCENEGLKGFRQ